MNCPKCGQQIDDLQTPNSARNAVIACRRPPIIKRPVGFAATAGNRWWGSLKFAWNCGARPQGRAFVLSRLRVGHQSTGGHLDLKCGSSLTDRKCGNPGSKNPIFGRRVTRGIPGFTRIMHRFYLGYVGIGIVRNCGHDNQHFEQSAACGGLSRVS